jgi:alpha-beta hydrolase superfamily lysophospholipase
MGNREPFRLLWRSKGLARTVTGADKDFFMTTHTPHESAAGWEEPAGLAARGTVVVLPGRGEQPGLYERFGRRLAADAYRVRVLSDATRDVEAVSAQVKALLARPDLRAPVVLVGSDSGGLLALRLVETNAVTADALVLAGLPDPRYEAAGVGTADEPEIRASCPTHQKLLHDRNQLERGALTTKRIPAALREPALTGVTAPVLGLHGSNDVISPIERVRASYAALPDARLSIVEDGRHDVLNAAHHRSVAATVVLFLERLRAGSGTIVSEQSLSTQVVGPDLQGGNDVR